MVTDTDAQSTLRDATQREGLSTAELIQFVLSEIMQRHKIPRDWIASEVHTLSAAHGKERVYVHLIMHRWSEHLLRYSAAIGRMLLIGLDQFEPHVSHAHYVLAWRFDPSCDLPFASIPDAVSWHVSVSPSKTLD